MLVCLCVIPVLGDGNDLRAVRGNNVPDTSISRLAAHVAIIMTANGSETRSPWSWPLFFRLLAGWTLCIGSGTRICGGTQPWKSH